MTTVFSDTFTGTDATQLQSHTPDVGTSWTRLWGSIASLDWVITSNQANPETSADNGVIYTADATYDSADYYIQWTLVTGPGASTTRATYAFVRIQDQENMYGVRLLGSTGTCQLYKRSAGTWTALGSAFTVPANGSVCKLEIIGTTLTFYDDGVSVASASDSDIGSAGKAGLGSGGGGELVTSTDDSNAANVWDTLTVVTSVAAGSIVPIIQAHNRRRKI